MARENLSIFDPASPQAAAIRDLAFISFAITGLILLIVEVVLIYSLVRFRRQKAAAATEPPQVYGSSAIEIAWTVAPLLIVFVLALAIARTEWEVRPNPPAPKTGDDALFVTVVGRQWWWEYRYEYYNGEKLEFVTANELHIPTGDKEASGVQRPVYLRLESADVCHSYWIPRLGGKTDLLPARTNHMTFRTAEQGLFLGQCAEFCGTQHAKMLLRVQADTPAEFATWLNNERSPAKTPTDKRTIAGRDAFFKQTCVNCHRIRGTSADGAYGPDLTHFMARKTLGSGILPNTAKNLRDWVANPQKIKPGCLMAAFGDLSEDDLDLIVDYLRSLE
jgi:cytochrome c oxidase subunit 2